ncbi:ATP-dependent helicase [Kitasatospora sp. NBC_01287]|uniref:ATP-dependent helicase n=1 Tax=Kitasatospora sp. NBC_01287 TaxID=2903573 RepID=UPI002258C26E|nr:ATP-dependent DNA helicase [Kitasatospora sp. NBC_01287]MCX4746885.1 ATP-dependent helicase [Kitasatospora sp. NBC_01287]
MASPYRLVRSPLATPEPPVLDEYQRAVAEHAGGPLLVLAGPGTGKTTTLVEAVARRVERGTDPERILVLTFSRKAAMELRDRLAVRLAAAPQATTFHSFCYALLRAHQEPERFAEPLRLLSGPEQDVMVRELLAGGAQDAAAGGGAGISWPLDLRACLTTRGFADEVRAVLARSRELGLGEAELARFARGVQRPDWAAAAHFLAEYLDVLDLRGVLDYAELVHRAVLLAERAGRAGGADGAGGAGGAAEDLAARYDVVFVDEYQDTDPAQVRLLRQLAGDGRDLVVVGDPDQSIYAFRGADVNGILDFPQQFRQRDGRPAEVRVLRVARRSAPVLLAASRELARRMPMSRLPAEKLAQHRALLPGRPGAAGKVEVYTYPTPGTELESVADLLRRAHLEDGVPWGEMAVLVRAGARAIPGVRRALSAAGVPLEVDGDDLPLREEPAVVPLLLALRVCAEGAVRQKPAAEDAVEETSPPPPDPLTVELAQTLLTGPLGALDGSDLRRLGRALREEERAAAREAARDAARDQAGALLRPSDELIREALANPEQLVTLDLPAARRARELGMLLRKVRDRLAGGGTAEDALWDLWDGSPRWRERLERSALRGGTVGRNADRDLDALCALFETAARAEDQVTGHRGALDLLAEVEAQDIAADTLTVRTARAEAVRLMTAHRSKGLEWRVVVVAGVQEGLWPDLRRRGSLLEADRIGRDGLAEPLSPGALLAEERRLFYVAATRAKERLIVTAVKAPAEDGDEPSRFLRELYREELDPRTGKPLRRLPEVIVEDVTHRPRRPLSVAALVAELRAVTVDPGRSPELRRAAAERLAVLAGARGEDGAALVPAAHPDRWWGMAEVTSNPVPLREPDRPIQLSGSGLEQLDACSLQWFLTKEVNAQSATSGAQGFGNVLHALADEVGSGRTPADLAVLLERLDTVWDALAFDAPWKSTQEKVQARAALERFLHWHVLERGRVTLATEHGFDLTLPVGELAVRIRGVMDRVEQDAGGRAYVVDFKTGKRAPSDKSLPEHKQLAVYQLAVREGALDELVNARPELGGAELVQLRFEDKKLPEAPKVQHQPPPEGEPWIENLLADAAGRVLAERFVPTTGDGCGNCGFKRSCSAQPDGRQLVD